MAVRGVEQTVYHTSFKKRNFARPWALVTHYVFTSEQIHDLRDTKSLGYEAVVKEEGEERHRLPFCLGHS